MPQPPPRSKPHAGRAGSLLATRTLLAALLVLTLASPVLAYTIYLKDGSTIIAQEKYRVEGDRAYIVLQNGTETFLQASEIDVERTEKANRRDVGTALVIEDGEVREGSAEDLRRERRQEETTLRDLIQRGAAGPSNVPEPRREDTREVEDGEPKEPTLPRTRAGYVDFGALDKEDFADDEAAARLREIFEAREVEAIEVFQGTSPRRPLVVVTTGSESGVRRATLVASLALLQFQEDDPGRMEAVELYVSTPSGGRGGQFVITPEVAQALLGRQLDYPTFFLRYVQF